MDAAAARRPALLITLAAVVAAALTGCVGDAAGPESTPSSATVAPTPTVEAEPVDPLTTVERIVVRPEQLELQDAGGVVIATLSYDDEAVQFVEVLTTVLR